jgi:hypothetical protein
MSLALASGACVLLVACGAHDTRPARHDAVDRGSDAFQGALARARAKRAALEMPPPPVGPGDSAQFNAYVRGPFKEWMVGASDRVRDARGAFDAASRQAPSAEAEIDVVWEELVALRTLGDHTVEASTHGLLVKYAGAPQVSHAFRAAVEDIVNPWAKPVLERCVARADLLAVRTAAAERCRAWMARVKGEEAANAKAEAAITDQYAGTDFSPLPWIPTVQREACVFSGSVRPGTASLALDGDGPLGVPPLAIRSDVVLRVDRLELPGAPGEKYSVTISHPFMAHGTLDAGARPVALPERIDLVPRRLWVEPGTSMSAVRVGPDRAKLSENLKGHRSDRDKPPSADDPYPPEEPEVDVTPSAVSRTAACSQVTLAGAPRTSPTPEEGQCVWMPGHRWLTLFVDPDGKQALARIWGTTQLRLLGDGGAFRHVVHEGDLVAFDGWLAASDVPKEECVNIAAVLLGGTWRRTPDGTTVDVRLRADPTAPVVFALAPQALVEVKQKVGDFAEVAIDGVSGPPLFIPATAIKPPPAVWPTKTAP